MNQTDIIILELMEYLRFKKLIKSEGDFARRLGMVQPTITKIKAGIAHFTVDQIKALCREFDVNGNFVLALSPVVFNYENSIEIHTYISAKEVAK